MDYQKHYDRLIETRKNKEHRDEFHEFHHILPKSMGGTNDDSNLVRLTPREHFIAHWLLWRIHRNRQMACAFHFLCMNLDKKTSRVYQEAKESHSKAISGINNGRYGGKGTTEETRQKIRNKKLGTKASDETRRKYSEQRQGSKNGRYGKSLLDLWTLKYGEEMASILHDEWRCKIGKIWKGKHKSEETKQKMSIAKIGHAVTEETKQKIRETKRKNKLLKLLQS